MAIIRFSLEWIAVWRKVKYDKSTKKWGRCKWISRKQGELIRQARMGNGYTQSELGALIGVSNKAVSRWENGESFPDIGVLENLLTALGISIQDIVTGSSGEADCDSIKEVQRIAKIQAKQKMKQGMATGVGVILFTYLFVRGYFTFSCKTSFVWQTNTYYYSLAIIMIVILGRSILDKKKIQLFPDKANKWVFVVGMVSIIYVLGMFWCINSIIKQGKIPFNIEVSSIGPFMNNQLIFAFLVNIIALFIDFVRYVKDIGSAHLGTYISVTVLHLVLIYGDLLQFCSEIGWLYQMLVYSACVLLAEAIAVIVLAFVIKVKDNGD